MTAVLVFSSTAADVLRVRDARRVAAELARRWRQWGSWLRWLFWGLR